MVLQLAALVLGLIAIGFIAGYYTRSRLSARRRRSRAVWRASIGDAG